MVIGIAAQTKIALSQICRINQITTLTKILGDTSLGIIFCTERKATIIEPNEISKSCLY